MVTIQTISPYQTWDDFRNFVKSPYEGDLAHCQKYIGPWFDELASRRDTIDLAFFSARNRITGHRVSGFSLCQQMFFTHSPYGLILPSQRHQGNSNDRSDRLVGIWLHHTPSPDNGFAAFFNGELQPIRRGEKTFQTYKGSVLDCARMSKVRSIIDDVEAGFTLASRHEPMNNLDEPWFSLGISSPKNSERHRDTKLRDINAWGRILVHAVEGIGTGYGLGAREDIAVNCPVGATSAHVGYKYMAAMLSEYADHGAWHWANGHPDGRAIIMWEPIEAKAVPFHEPPQASWWSRFRKQNRAQSGVYAPPQATRSAITGARSRWDIQFG